MYAKSFIAFDGNGRLTGARTVQTAPYDRYTCHLCGSSLRYHPQYDTERPWFEHTDDGLTAHGQQGNDSNLLIVFYVQIMPDDFVMQLHRF